MSSFKDIRDFVFLGYAHDMFDDEEFCLLYDFYQSKNPDFPYNSYASFDLGEMDPAECYTEFRVEKWHIPLLADRLQIPPTFQCPQRSVCDGIEGLCMLLKRLAYPCRYSDMVHRFARPVPVLSMITNTVLDYVYDRHGHRLTQWNNQVMDPNHLQQYADVISAKGSPLDNCFGFGRWHGSTNKSPRTAPEGCIQWTQESPCIKISICCSTEWVNRKPIWPNR